MRTKRTLLAFATSCLAFFSQAQDIHFSQINETPLLINPANAGLGCDMRAILNYRTQWSSVTTPYKTFAASYEMKLLKKKPKGNLGLGVYAFNDKAGTSNLSTSQFTLAFSGMISLDKSNTLSAGISGGYNQRSCTTAGLKWDSQYDGTGYNSSLGTNESFTDARFGYADFNAGIQWSYGQGERYITAKDEIKMNAGVSFHHFNRPEQVFYASGERLNSRITAHGGCIFGISNTNVFVAPSFIYHRQGTQTETMAGSMLKFRVSEDSKYTGFKKGASFSLGGFYRVRDAFVAVAQFELGQYSIAMSYDINVSSLTQASKGRGGFEISLRFVNPNPYVFKSASRM
ncbi:MAG: PorP/SprF family type IX secretion system membrane protein [Bacteroidota bacterium]